MSKSIEAIVSEFVSARCTPIEDERSFARDEYAFLYSILPGSSFQSGSYARFTAITPLNDLDVIWVLPVGVKQRLEERSITMEGALSEMAQTLEGQYRKAEKLVAIRPQSHSMVIEFPDHEGEFSIDVVPAYELLEKNTFGDPLYRIPEVGLMNRGRRERFYANRDPAVRVKWIKTDPKGYIGAARSSNDASPSFRKATKLVKKWKRVWKDKRNFRGTEFKLKSFHLEIIVQSLVDADTDLCILDAVESALRDIDNYISRPRFPDRAQTLGEPTRYIDQYVDELTADEKRMIRIAAASAVELLRYLKDTETEDVVLDWLNRFVSGEEFIEAYGYGIDSQTAANNGVFKVDAYVRKRNGFLHGWLSSSAPLRKGLSRGSNNRKLDFRVTRKPQGDYVTYWKVRNTGQDALDVDSLRGEICKYSTLRRPEQTAYRGDHYVRCYLVDESAKRVVAYDTVTVRIK